MTTIQQLNTSNWQENFSIESQQHAIENLESGKILFFPNLNFVLNPNESRFLDPDFTDPKNKNISFNAKTNTVRGAVAQENEITEIKILLKRYFDHTNNFIAALFPNYMTALEPARTSFRPVEVEGRISSYRKDDARLHIDAFPSTPNQGRRLLRVFCNINPHNKPRVWRVGDEFENVAKYFLPKINKPWPGSHYLLKRFNLTKTKRSDYDHYMLRMHNLMKADLDYQKNAAQIQFDFPAQSCWIVMTDHVSHAAMSGQHLLEQTYYLPVDAMQNPQYSPLKVLERLLNKPLV